MIGKYQVVNAGGYQPLKCVWCGMTQDGGRALNVEDKPACIRCASADHQTRVMLHDRMMREHNRRIEEMSHV